MVIGKGSWLSAGSARRQRRHPLIRGLLAIGMVLGVSAATLVGAAPVLAAPSTTQVQWDLAGLGYLPMSGIDGVYGSQTTAAAKAFQTDQCLQADGIAGSMTDAALAAVIKQVQDTVRATSDGNYGPTTKSLVASWQSANHLTSDGVAGPATMAAMFIPRNHQCSGPPSTAPSGGSSTTAQLQWDLAGLGYLAWSNIDGLAGPITAGATQAFQGDRCIQVDGVAGTQTFGALSSVIRQVQAAVGTTADGAYGPNTRTAVASWQSSHSLSADGVAGPATMKAMAIARIVSCTAPPSGAPTPGSSAVVQLQWDLAGLGYLPWSGIDGITGPVTAGATQAFQGDRCIQVDGIAGTQTMSALSGVIQQVQRVAGTSADGAYGPNTRTAVASWQSAHGLTADGAAGPATMKAMAITRTTTCSTPPPTGTPLPGDVGNAIASIAAAEASNSSHNHEQGGYNCNYYSTALQVGTTGACSNGWRTEEWCADFAKWVWLHAGVSVGGLTPGAVSFAQYGKAHGTWHTASPRVGDAVVFGLNGTSAQHVGLVTAVSGANITVTSGNSYNAATGQDDHVGAITIAASGGGISGFTDPVTTQPSSNNQTAFNYFVGNGLSKIQAAAIVGNFDQESGPTMDPTATQSPGAGRGIGQWSVGGRWDTKSNDNVLWYAGAHSQSAWALSLQLAFTWYELGTFSGYGLASLRSSTDISSAVTTFQNSFEGCGTCMTANRIRFADQALAYYG